MKKIFLACLAVGLFLFGIVEIARAAPIILQAEADTHIRTDVNARRNDNYGMERFISIGTSRGGGGIPFGGADAMRLLIRFDVSGFTSLAESAILELTVHSFDQGSPSSVYTVDVHSIVDSALTPWIEGDGAETSPSPPGASNVDAAFGVAWVGAGDGGDANNQTQPPFDPLVIASATIDQGVNVKGDVIQWDITSLVNTWISGGSNNGIMLTDMTTNNLFRGVRFGAREGNIYDLSDAVDGPRLLYDPKPKTIALDIKPQSCPNPINVKSKGVLPVAVLGGYDLDGNAFDVSMIDTATLRLEGVPPVRSAHEDVSTATGLDSCNCLVLGGDGSEDLVLKFDTQAIVAVLGIVQNGEEIPLMLTGMLKNGNAFEGVDCVVIKGVK